MTKDNYLSWQINADDFEHSWPEAKKLKFFVRYALLAPSGHNTQPWKFSVKGKFLSLEVNPERLLDYSGTKAAEPHVSIGTCLETLVLAANGFGYELDANYQLSNNLCVKLHIKGKIAEDSELLDAITRRSSNRNYFEQRALPAQQLSGFTAQNLPGVSTHILSKKDDISFIAHQTAIATKKLMGDQGLRDELSKWVRNNLTNQYDGMPGYTQGMPLPPSLVAKHVIKHIDVSKTQANKDSARVVNSANLVIIMIDSKSDIARVNGGRLYARICVLAQKDNVMSSGVGAAVIDQTSRADITSRFGLKAIPLAIVRLGITEKTARHTPRIPITKMLSD